MTSRTVYIGIDPGMHGAIAVRGNGGIWIYDIPLTSSKVLSGNNVKEQTDIDINQLNRIVRSILSKTQGCQVVIACEHSAGMAYAATANRERHHDSPKTAWKIGYNFGVIRTVFAVAGIPFDLTPRPGDWKRWMELTDSKLTYNQKKNKARAKAIELFPMLQDALKRVKDSDRAEALLLTVWAEKQRITRRLDQ